MSGYEKMSDHLKLQHTSAYGPYVAGDYSIGDTLAVPGTSGTVVWSFQSERGLCYCIDDHNGLPTVVRANEVYGPVSPWTS
jgi:hypothetical protein